MARRPAAVNAFAVFAVVAGAVSAQVEIVHALDFDSCADRLSLLQTRAGSLRSRPATADAADDEDTSILTGEVAAAGSSHQFGDDNWAASDSLASLVEEALADGPAAGLGGFDAIGAGGDLLGSSAAYKANADIPQPGSAAEDGGMPELSVDSSPVVKMMTQNGEVDIPIVMVNRSAHHAHHRPPHTRKHIGMLSTQHATDQVARDPQGDRIPGNKIASAEKLTNAMANFTSVTAALAPPAMEPDTKTALPAAAAKTSVDAKAQLLLDTAAALQKLAGRPAASKNSSTAQLSEQLRNTSATDAKDKPAKLFGRAPSTVTDTDLDEGSKDAKSEAEELLRVAREVTDELRRTAAAERHQHRQHHQHRASKRRHRRVQSSRAAGEGDLHSAAGAAADGAHSDPLCASGRALSFQGSGVAASNLGGQGPDEGYPWLVFTNVTTLNGSQVDLTVLANSSYRVFDNTKNGLNGPFGVINLGVNSKVDLKFSFVNHSTGLPVVLEPFYFTFFDFDQGLAHGARETVTVSGSEAFMLSDETEVGVEHQTEDGTVVFASSMRGGKLDNPVFPGILTHLQQDRSVTLLFKNSSDFSITLEELGYPDLAQGRNFLFSGPSELACPQEHRCVEYQCPEGYHIRTMAEFLLCDGSPCSEQDLDTCCYDAEAATVANSTKDADGA